MLSSPHSEFWKAMRMYLFNKPSMANSCRVLFEKMPFHWRKFPSSWEGETNGERPGPGGSRLVLLIPSGPAFPWSLQCHLLRDKGDLQRLTRQGLCAPRLLLPMALNFSLPWGHWFHVSARPGYKCRRGPAATLLRAASPKTRKSAWCPMFSIKCQSARHSADRPGPNYGTQNSFSPVKTSNLNKLWEKIILQNGDCIYTYI